MYDKHQRNDFLTFIKNSEPTHYDSSDLSLMKDLAHDNYEFYSSAFLPLSVVTVMAMNFVYRYASYTPSSLLKKDEMFLIKQPLFVYCSSEGKSDRTLIWANGFLSLTDEDVLSLFVDKDLVELLQDGE